MMTISKFKISTTQQLLLFTFCLTIIRILKYENVGILFLAWNLFLAWCPYAISLQIKRYPSRLWQFGIFGLSLLFLPNSIYIFTDLFHLKKNLPGPLWFELLLFLSYALLGFLFYAKTLREMLIFISEKTSRQNRIKQAEFVLVMLSSFGVYLGRYLRLNSWDVFTNPKGLFVSLKNEVSDGKLLEMFQVTLFFGMFIYILNRAAQKRWE